MNTDQNSCYKCSSPITPQDKAQHGLHEACFEAWFQLKHLDDFRDLMAKESESKKTTGAFSAINSSFFHGKFRKYSADLGDHSYILKVQMPEFPELPATEYLCNQMAEALGIKVPDFFLIKFNDLPTFVTRNFIDKGKISNLIHIYRYLPGDESLVFSCETIFKIIEKETGRIQETERFLELCLFDSLIGNNDRHGRNIAIIEMSDRKILAPFYDNPSYIGVEIENLLGADHNPGGTVSTPSSIVGSSTMKDYVQEIRRLGYDSIVIAFKKKVAMEMANLIALIEKSEVSEKRKTAFKKLLRKRYDELETA